MWPYLQKYWPLVCLQLASYAAGALVAAAAANAIKDVTNAAIAADWARVQGIIPVIVGLMAAGALASFAATASSGWFGSIISRELRADTIQRMLGLPYAYYETHHTGDLVSRLTNDINRLQGFFENTFGSLVREPLVFVVVAAWMATIDPWLLLPTLFLTALTVIYNLRMGPRLVEHYTKQHEGYSDMTKSIQDTIQGVGIVKAYGLGERMMDRIKQANQKIAANFLGVIDITTRRTYLAAINRHVPLLITVLWGGWRAIQGDLTPGALFAFLFLFRYLAVAITFIPEICSETQGIGAVVRRIDALAQEAPERTSGGCFAHLPGTPCLEIRDVHFAYSPDQPVLRGIDLSVRPGETIALVGASGCGKSTLLKLLCGFDDVQQGTIALYGHPYAEWSLAGLREHVSLVSQDSFLFPATIAENIGYGGVEADHDRIVQAAVLAGADEFIGNLPEGYNTMVGERGVRLSGGQRQRIAIARALLKDAPILLLDEPTSSLDAESEALVQAGIDRLMAGRTVIVAAHRLRTVRQASQILVLEEGRIVERGTHDGLMAADGPYRRLYGRQLGGVPS